MKPIILFALFFLSLGCKMRQKKDSQKQDSTNNELKSYKNSVEGFTLTYPAKWDTTNIDNRIIFMAVEKRVSDKDEFIENLSLYKVEIPEAATLDLVLKNAENEFLNKYKAGKVVERDIKQNAKGLTYAFFKSSIPQIGSEAITTATYFKKGKNIYVLTLGNSNSDSSQYNLLYSKIINEFYFN